MNDAHDVVYYISMLSTTGQKLKVSPSEIKDRFNLIKTIAPEKKCIIGFGITEETIADFKDTDACVVELLHSNYLFCQTRSKSNHPYLF